MLAQTGFYFGAVSLQPLPECSGARHSFDKLKKLTIKAKLTEIDRCAFEHCNNLQEIYLPETVAKIGKQAFYNCSNLRYLHCMNKDVKIEYDAFQYCGSLKNIDEYKNIEGGKMVQLFPKTKFNPLP